MRRRRRLYIRRSSRHNLPPRIFGLVDECFAYSAPITSKKKNRTRCDRIVFMKLITVCHLKPTYLHDDYYFSTGFGWRISSSSSSSCLSDCLSLCRARFL